MFVVFYLIGKIVLIIEMKLEVAQIIWLKYLDFGRMKIFLSIFHITIFRCMQKLKRCILRLWERCQWFLRYAGTRENTKTYANILCYSYELTESSYSARHSLRYRRRYGIARLQERVIRHIFAIYMSLYGKATFFLDSKELLKMGLKMGYIIAVFVKGCPCENI